MMKNGNILIWTVTLMDLITAILILTNPHPLLVARLGIFYQIFPQSYVGAFLILLAACLAIFGLKFSVTSSFKRFLLFIPQQIFLLMTTSSAIDFIVLQHYADGITRSWQFILQDQLPSIVLTIGYFLAILDLEKKTKCI